MKLDVYFGAQMSQKYYKKSILLFHKGNTLWLFDTIINNNLWQVTPEPIQTEDTLQEFFLFFLIGQSLHQSAPVWDSLQG